MSLVKLVVKLGTEGIKKKVPFFSYNTVLLLRRTVSDFEFSPMVRHSWFFSIYMKDL